MVLATGLCRVWICRVHAWVYRIDAEVYRISVGMYRVGCGDLVIDLVETTIFLPDILLSFKEASSLLFVFFLWIFVDVNVSAIKLIMISNRTCFCIGIRISPGSTGVYRVDAGSAVSVPWPTVLAPGCNGLCRALPCSRRGLPCWHCVQSGSAVFTSG